MCLCVTWIYIDIGYYIYHIYIQGNLWGCPVYWRLLCGSLIFSLIKCWSIDRDLCDLITIIYTFFISHKLPSIQEFHNNARKIIWVIILAQDACPWNATHHWWHIHLINPLIIKYILWNATKETQFSNVQFPLVAALLRSHMHFGYKTHLPFTERRLIKGWLQGVIFIIKLVCLSTGARFTKMV